MSHIATIIRDRGALPFQRDPTVLAFHIRDYGSFVSTGVMIAPIDKTLWRKQLSAG